LLENNTTHCFSCGGKLGRNCTLRISVTTVTTLLKAPGPAGCLPKMRCDFCKNIDFPGIHLCPRPCGHTLPLKKFSDEITLFPRAVSLSFYRVQMWHGACPVSKYSQFSSWKRVSSCLVCTKRSSRNIKRLPSLKVSHFILS